ncbi:hypothetical protein CSPHI_10605 [Corynebacterium sphenisci DSM 44792]|uniref:Uncharacterized protein n=1 Tax=Corynebacterium sphenisci DSM 44792 TaxID=1437874 RepID=A0A1L7CZQ8_9CORY|nr:hypothetical protein [Corynebacterium sphenisci]APT91369.1 hypothetical protein CSPHI_10605 [Corynebacterium sphenisci DSM 44792]
MRIDHLPLAAALAAAALLTGCGGQPPAPAPETVTTTVEVTPEDAPTGIGTSSTTSSTSTTTSTTTPEDDRDEDLDDRGDSGSIEEAMADYPNSFISGLRPGSGKASSSWDVEFLPGQRDRAGLTEAWVNIDGQYANGVLQYPRREGYADFAVELHTRVTDQDICTGTVEILDEEGNPTSYGSVENTPSACYSSSIDPRFPRQQVAVTEPGTYWLVVTLDQVGYEPVTLAQAFLVL